MISQTHTESCTDFKHAAAETHRECHFSGWRASDGAVTLRLLFSLSPPSIFSCFFRSLFSLLFPGLRLQGLRKFLAGRTEPNLHDFPPALGVFPSIKSLIPTEPWEKQRGLGWNESVSWERLGVCQSSLKSGNLKLVMVIHSVIFF